MIFLHFRSVVATLLTLIPLAVGCIWTLGWMPIHALQFNPANIIALPLTVGIGIAFGVYLVDRFRETGVAGSFCNSTGRAILLSALTTMIGFGSLIPGNHQGIATLGTLMTGGVGYCLLSALIVLPPILEIFRRKGWKL
jgi:predicted RND superfamily exporter protein